MKIKQYLQSIATFQTHFPFVTVGIIFAITLIALVGGSQVQTVASLENMMPPQLEEIHSFRLLRNQGLGQDIIAIVLQVNTQSTLRGERDITDQDVFIYMQDISRSLSHHTDVLRINSPSDIFVENIRNIDSLEYNQLLQENEQFISQFVAYDSQTAIMLLFTDVSATDERMILLADQVRLEIESLGMPAHIRYELTGTPIVQQKLGVLIGEDRSVTQNISTIFVFIITAIIFGAITTAVVPILVVTISVTWLYGVMGFAGLPISTLAGGVAAMVIGIGIDYSIHIINRYKHQKKSCSSDVAIVEAVSHTGYALLGASVATIFAFLSFLVGSMPEMGRFGLLMAIGVSLSYILSIFGLPAFLLIEEKIIKRFAKKSHFGIRDEYVLKEERK